MEHNPPDQNQPAQPIVPPQTTPSATKKSRTPMLLIVFGALGIVTTLLFGLAMYYASSQLDQLYQSMKIERPAYQSMLLVGSIIFSIVYSLIQLFYGLRLKENPNPSSRQLFIGRALLILPMLGAVLTIPMTLISVITPIYSVINTVGEINTPTPTESPSAIINPDDRSNWKTYRNEEYGFEFQYPENWGTISIENASSHIDPIFTSHIGFGFFDNKNHVGEEVPIFVNERIIFHSTRTNRTDIINELIKTNFSTLNAKISQRQINNLTFTVVQHTGGLAGGYDLLIHKDGTLVEIEAGLAVNGSDKETVDQILSTFKFVDSETQTDIIPWSQAVLLIDDCKVSMAMQTHSLMVTLSLKDGEQVTAKEPKIDDVFTVIKNAEDTCGQIPLATE